MIRDFDHNFERKIVFSFVEVVSMQFCSLHELKIAEAMEFNCLRSVKNIFKVGGRIAPTIDDAS